MSLDHSSLDLGPLDALGVSPSSISGARPMRSGLSGASLTRLTLDIQQPSGAVAYRTRVLKQVPPHGSWLSVAARDDYVREARIWLSGLLRSLPAQVETPIIAAAIDGPAGAPRLGALLQRDVASRLFRTPTRTPPGRLPECVALLLDGLAHVHARYWRDDRLREPALGLMPMDAALLFLAPASIARARASGDPNFYLPLAQAGWDAFFRLAEPEDAETLLAVQRAPEAWLARMLALPATLVHGDIWGPNLGTLPATRIVPRRGRRLLLLDWALALAGPATFDPLWLCGTWHALDPVRVLAAYRSRLERHLAARHVYLPARMWQDLADAGYLRTALTCGEALGRTAATSPAGAGRRAAEARVRWWARRAALGARRLVAGD